MNPQYLIYALADPRTDEMYFIGMSSRGLVPAQAYCTKSGRNARTPVGQWMAQLWAESGRTPSIQILEDCKTYAEAVAHTTRLLEELRAAGHPLTNCHSGVGGVFSLSRKTRQRLRKASEELAFPIDEDIRQKLLRIESAGRRALHAAPAEIRRKVQEDVERSQEAARAAHAASTDEEVCKAPRNPVKYTHPVPSHLPCAR